MPNKNPSSAEVTTHPGNAGLIAFACMLLVGTLLGLSLVLAKLAISYGASPLSFLAMAMLWSGTVLLVAERCKGHALAVNARIVEYGLIAGALFALPNAIGFMAVEHVGAGFLSLTFAFPILITYILALVLKMERFKWAKMFGVVCGMSGGIILAWSKISSGDSPLLWVTLSMIPPFIIAVANIYRTLRWPAGASSMFLAALMLLVSGFLLVPFAIGFSPGGFVMLFTIPQVLLVLIAQTCLFSVMYLFYFILQRRAGPVYLSQIGSVAAVVGTLTAVLLLGEAAPENILYAAGLITAGTLMFYFATIGRK